MTDYKAKCEELTVEYIKVKRENDRLKEDILWIKKVLAYTLQKTSAIVVREEDLSDVPEIELEENLADEMIIRVREHAVN